MCVLLVLAIFGVPEAPSSMEKTSSFKYLIPHVQERHECGLIPQPEVVQNHIAFAGSGRHYHGTKKGAASLKEAGIADPAKHFKGKTITAKGKVKEVDGVPRIEIDEATQLSVVAK